MPKIQGRVLKTKASDGMFQALIQLNGKLPKDGELVMVKWGATRSLMQNSFYWTYLSWLIDHGGMKEHGHFCAQALHDDMKAHFLASKVMDKGQFKAIEDGTTTDLNKVEFADYMDRISAFLQEFLGIDSSPFFEQYRKNYT